MLKLLVSVTDIEEAQIALSNGADIIDLKDPTQGALGALPLPVSKKIVADIRISEFHNAWISATIGDLPMDPELICQQVELVRAPGVDLIKVGFFNDSATSAQHNEQHHLACARALKPLADHGVRLIAVLFAEFLYAPQLIDHIKNSGFYGVMIDTSIKNGTTLFDRIESSVLLTLKQTLEARGLAFGMAGSLKPQHIALVKQYKPEFIGFRTGVCRLNQRMATIDPEKVKKVRQML